MTSGHEAVKADLVAHLGANIGDSVDVVAVDSWPPAPALVAATDILPVDEDKPWPCVLVSTTSMSTTTRAAGVGSGVFIGDYGVRVTVAGRPPKSKGFDQAAVGRRPRVAGRTAATDCWRRCGICCCRTRRSATTAPC